MKRTAYPEGGCSLPARIAEAGNTQFSYALGALAARGFTVVIRPETPDSEQRYWAIHTDGTSLVGSSPLVLLGLLSLLDQMGEDWYRAPRVRFPKADVVDLTPDGLDHTEDADLPRASEAFQLLGRILDQEPPQGSTREDLLVTSRAWIEAMRREEEEP